MIELMAYALNAGISYGDFWDMTLLEVNSCLKVYNENQRAEVKTKVAQDYNLASMIAMVFSGKRKSLYELYPELYAEEAEQEQINRLKAQMIQYAEYNNAKLRKRGDKDIDY